MSSEPLTAEAFTALDDAVTAATRRSLRELAWRDDAARGGPAFQEARRTIYADELAKRGLRLAAASEEPRPRSEADRLDPVRGAIQTVVFAMGTHHQGARASLLRQWSDLLLAALPSPRSDDREVTLREAAQRLVDAIGRIPREVTLPTDVFEAARRLSAALAHSAPDTVGAEPAAETKPVDIEGTAALLGIEAQDVRNLMDAGVLTPLPGFAAPDTVDETTRPEAAT